MANGSTREKQQAHERIERLPPAQLSAVVGLLEAMLDPFARTIANAPIDDEPVTAEEKKALAESREWLKHNKGIPHGQVLAELGSAKKKSTTSNSKNRSGADCLDRSSSERCPQPKQAHRHADSLRVASLCGIGRRAT